jgi:N-acetylneuraminic acid mutarotase
MSGMAQHFSALDHGVFAAYLLGTLALGTWFVRGQRSLDEYFLAGRSMGSVLLAMTILASRLARGFARDAMGLLWDLHFVPLVFRDRVSDYYAGASARSQNARRSFHRSPRAGFFDCRDPSAPITPGGSLMLQRSTPMPYRRISADCKRRRAQGVLLSAAAWMMGNPLGASAVGWERRASLPEANGGCVAGALGGKIVLLGGTNWREGNKLWFDRIWIYDQEEDGWRDAGRLEAPLAYAAAGQDAASLWFAGGSSGAIYHRTLWRLGPDWRPQQVAKLEVAFVFAGGAVLGSRLYVVGGSDDQARLDHLTRQCITLDLADGTVTRLPDYPEAAFGIGAAAACGGRFFVFGGARLDPATGTVVNHAAAHVFSPAAGIWTPLPPLPAPIRGLAAVALDAGHIFIAGGYHNDTGFTAAAYLFEVETGDYLLTTPLPYAAGLKLVKLGDWLYCLGGEDQMRRRTDAVFRIRWRDVLTTGR